MRRRSASFGGLWLALLSTLVAVVIALFPQRGHGAPRGAADAGSARKAPLGSHDAGAKIGDGGAKASDGGTKASDGGLPAAPADEKPPPANGPKHGPGLPTGKGLPVQVNVGVFFLEVLSFDDNKGEFEATTDVRMRWTDLRLRYEKGEELHGYREYRGDDAEEELTKIWAPSVDVTNRTETAPYVGRRVRIFPNGDVELITRTTAKYKAKVDPERFPFDRQHLTLQILVRQDTTDEVELNFDATDVAFSRVARAAKLEGWLPGLVELSETVVPGWNGDRYAHVTASLFVDRQATTSLAPIFIPLVASLLIPLLAIWMNKATKEGFEIPAFELANMGIGGLFSVIALSFAIYSAYGVIAGSDNTVTRLFALNYVSIAIALGVVVFFFRYNILHRMFGPYVQEQAFNFVTWALPVLSLSTSVAFMLAAAA